jgi:cytidylate kinase
MGKTIAIDGPSGAGKSTVARMVAKALGFRYLDTGALYRAAALGLRRQGVAVDASDEEISKALDSISLEFKDGEVYLVGEKVSVEIRTPEIGHLSSVFSARKPVRDYLLPVQQDAGCHHDLVAEGRDMATVVFPDSWGKFYLDADVESRARRRFLQLEGQGVPISMERAREDVVSRDERDSKRDLAPLRVAEDAVFLDTSRMSLEEVIQRVLAEVGEKG